MMPEVVWWWCRCRTIFGLFSHPFFAEEVVGIINFSVTSVILTEGNEIGIIENGSSSSSRTPSNIYREERMRWREGRSEKKRFRKNDDLKISSADAEAAN